MARDRNGPHWRRDRAAPDPACRHGRVLRVGRAAPSPRPRRPAGRGRRHRPPRCRRRCVVRGPTFRGPLGDAVGGGPTALPACRVPARRPRALRRGERAGPRDLRPVHAARRAAVARRGVPRRHRLDPAVRAGAGDRRHDPAATSRDELSLGCSVGVAPNKFLAKLASVEAKPRATPAGIEPGAGVVVVVGRARSASSSTRSRCSGCGASGPVTLDKLHRIGIRRVADFAAVDARRSRRRSAPDQADHLMALSTGIDDRPVEPEREAKSIGHEETYSSNKHEHAETAPRAGPPRRCGGVAAARSRRRGAHRDAQAALRHRIPDDHPVGHLSGAGRPGAGDHRAADARCSRRSIRRRASVCSASRVRTWVRACASSASTTCVDEQPDWAATTAALDQIRDRFGARPIGPASALESGRLRVSGAASSSGVRTPKPTVGGRPASPSEPSDEAGRMRENPPHRVEDRPRTCDDCLVPLSEDEQRILRQIEQELEQDPTFSQRGYRVSRRRSILLAVGLVARPRDHHRRTRRQLRRRLRRVRARAGDGDHARVRAAPARPRTARSAADLGMAERSAARRRRRRHPLNVGTGRHGLSQASVKYRRSRLGQSSDSVAARSICLAQLRQSLTVLAPYVPATS